MFDHASFGLELPVDLLRRSLHDIPVDRITGFLAHAKLGRFGERGRVFSFVHRRFNEFFLVQWLLQDDSRAYERARTIPEDGRWRDALVLYIEIAKSDASSVIADLCFSKSTKLLASKVAREMRPMHAAYTAFALWWMPFETVHTTS